MQKARFASELCVKCIDQGINVLATYAQYEPQSVQDAVNSSLPFDLKSLT
jgi:hypothetical protein